MRPSHVDDIYVLRVAPGQGDIFAYNEGHQLHYLQKRFFYKDALLTLLYLQQNILFSQVGRASGCQCQSRNCPRFGPSILRHSGI